MPIFVVQFRNLENQISKLEKQIKKYDTQIKETRKTLESHDLQQEIEDLKTFKTDLFELITEAVRIPTSPQQDEEIVESIFDENSEREDLSDLFRKDIFGNSLESDLNLYNYAEISYGSYDYFLKVRLLGVKDLTKIRYEVTDLSHPFSPTTIKLLESIRDITEDTNLLALKDLLTCSDKRDAWKKDLDTITGRIPPPEYKYTWSEFIDKFLVPKGKLVDSGDAMTDEERRALIAYYNKKSTLTKEELIRQNLSIQQNKQALLKKAEAENEKPIDIAQQLRTSLEASARRSSDKAKSTILGFLDKHSLGCLIKEALNCVTPVNFNCREFFRDLTVVEILDRISLVFPRASDTFKQLEKVIEENVLGEVANLKTQILKKEARIAENERLLEELRGQVDIDTCSDSVEIPPADVARRIERINTLIANTEVHKEELQQLKQKLEAEANRVAGDLSLSERQKATLQESGNIGAILALPVNEGEEIGIAAMTDKALSAIDLVVPFEDLCEAITNSISMTGGEFPFIQFEGFPKLDFPKPRPVNDIFSGISLEISDLFIQGLVQGMIAFLQGFLGQLLNCDALDAFVASALGAPPNDQNQGIWGDLGMLFGGNTDFPNSQQILDQQVDQFIEQTTPYFERMLDIKISGSSPTGTNAATSVGLDSQATATFLRGEETTPQEQAAAATEQTLVTNASSNRQGILEALFQQGDNPLGNWDISFDGEKFEIVSGLKTFDIADIDRFLNSVSLSAIRTLEGINTDQFSLGALQDALILLNSDSRQPDLALQEPSTVTQAATKEEIRKEFGALMRTCSSMLTPTETINLLAGTPSPNSLKLTKELMSLKSPKLAKVFKNNSQIKNLFANFGKVTGLDALKTELEIIASSPEGRKRIVSSNACVPYDNLDDFRKSLLEKEVEPELATSIIENINAEKNQNLKNMANAILDAAKGVLPGKMSPSKEQATKAILDALKNGQVSDPEDPEETVPEKKPKPFQEQIDEENRKNLEKSDAFKDILNTSIQSLFIPIKDAFDDDMKNYGELLSVTKEEEVKIKRKDVIKSGSSEIEVISSEFRQIINSGLAPVVDPNDRTRAILVPAKQDGEPEKGDAAGKKDENFLDNDLPLYKKENVKLVGYAFKKAHEDIFSRVNATITEDKFSISLRGSQQDNNAIVQFSSLFNGDNPMVEMLSQIVPRWTIKLEETKDATQFDILPTGSYYTPIYGLQKFGSELSHVSAKPQIDPEMNSILDRYFGQNIRLDSFNSSTAEGNTSETIPNRHSVFLSLVDKNRHASSVLTSETSRNNFYSDLLKKHQGAVSTFFDLIAKALVKTSLLEDVELSNSPLLSEQPKSKTIATIQLIDFIRKQTEEEKEKNIDPHIMDFAYIEKYFKELYDKNKEKVDSDLQQLRGLKKRDSRFAKSANPVLAKLFIKLCVADYLFKTIFVSDFFDFSKEFSKLELVNKHISNNIYNELQQKQIYEMMYPHIKTLYKEEVERGNVEKITEKEFSDFKNCLVSYPPEIKKIAEAETYSLYCKIAAILCREQTGSNWSQFIKPILKQIPEIDLHPREEDSRVYAELFLKYRKAETGNQTLSRNLVALTENPVFVMERYVKFEKLNDAYLLQKGYPQSWINNNRTKFENKEVPLNRIDEYLSNFSFLAPYNTSIPVATRNTNSAPEVQLTIDEARNFIVFDCDDTTNSLYTSVPQYGMKMSIVYDTDKQDFSGSKFFYDEARVSPVHNLALSTYKNNFLSFPISVSEKTVARTMTFLDFIDLSNQGIYEQLREELINSDEVKMMFGYAVPIKEISSMMLINSYYVHSDERFINFYEPTKLRITRFMEMLEKIGVKVNSLESYTKIKEAQKEARENQGNPGGPIDLDALKAYLRTPIQLLRGIATLIDPNIFITDKIVAVANVIAGLTGQKIFLPYSAVSLGLLPFPLFTPPPVGAVPPLTAYNIVTPLGPIFLALEPLLWDLPYFQLQAQGTEQASNAIGNIGGKQSALLEASCNKEEENNNE